MMHISFCCFLLLSSFRPWMHAQKTSVDFSTEVFFAGQPLLRRSTPASQGYKDSNLEMTESESVAFFSAIPVITRLSQIVLFGIDL